MTAMQSQLLGDMVLIIHLLFILFVVFGALLMRHCPALIFLHLPAVLWGTMVELRGWPCPLTPLENHFRQAAGQGAYGGGFLENYITPLVYPPGLSRQGQMTLGLLVLLINVLLYGRLLHQRGRDDPDRPR